MSAKITVNTTAALLAWNRHMQPAMTALDVNFTPATVSASPVLASALSAAAEDLTTGLLHGADYLVKLGGAFVQAMENLETVERHNTALAGGDVR